MLAVTTTLNWLDYLIIFFMCLLACIVTRKV